MTHTNDNMKKILFMLAVVATLASCKKNSEEIIEPPKPLSPDIDLAINGATKESQALYPSSSTFNYLGYGYDVTENFNSEASIRASVVDMPSFDADPLHSVNLSRGTESSWTTLVANNAVDLSEKLSNSFMETKGLMLFGQILNEAFPVNDTKDSKYVYAYYSYYMIRKRHRFYYDQSVNGFLTNGFKQDINLLSAENLITKYGTHVLVGVKVGAKFDVMYQAIAAEGDRQKISMEGQRYALKNTFGLPSGYLDDVNLADLNANSAAKVYYTSVGGDIQRLKTQTAGKKVIVNISNWVSSTTEDKARFIGALDEGIVPIYSFINDATKKAQVKAYFDQYLVAKTVRLAN